MSLGHKCGIRAAVGFAACLTMLSACGSGGDGGVATNSSNSSSTVEDVDAGVARTERERSATGGDKSDNATDTRSSTDATASSLGGPDEASGGVTPRLLSLEDLQGKYRLTGEDVDLYTEFCEGVSARNILASSIDRTVVEFRAPDTDDGARTITNAIVTFGSDAAAEELIDVAYRAADRCPAPDDLSDGSFAFGYSLLPIGDLGDSSVALRLVSTDLPDTVMGIVRVNSVAVLLVITDTEAISAEQLKSLVERTLGQ